jgi:hypothetical protein
MELTFALGALSRSCGPERDIVNWILGGNTDLNNLTLLCRYHHTPFLQKRLDLPHQYRRLPEWTPHWIDQNQHPQAPNGYLPVIAFTLS